TQPRFGIPSYANANSSNTHPDYPIVILVNSSSASASEIVSGALQDEKYKRAVIVGDRTYGKGSVQGITQYSNGGLAQLKYTMAYYHLPSGQRVESKEEVEEKGRKDWGITPDVEVKLKSNEFKAMFDARRDNDVLVKAGHNDENIPVKKHSIQDMLDADPQLAIGVLVVKSKLIQSGNYISVSEQGK
ncbi:MAG TPA: S41 family peptidase, partial [Sedimentisphaerales bacterium]|nr:S41 family peptidase [Sedimentisphaerales bacterium]